MNALASTTIFQEIASALEGIVTLGGSQLAPTFQRYDKERRSTAKLPGIQLRRLNEDHSGGEDGGDEMEIRLNGEICLYVYRDEEAAETYDETVEIDMGDLLKALYALPWDELLPMPILTVTWTPLNVENEEDPEDGAVIRFTVTYRSSRAHLHAVAPPGKE